MEPTGFPYEVFEVFVQRTHADPHVHAGSLVAPNPELALVLARENFARRDGCVSIWVSRRADVHAAGDGAFYTHATDRTYREVKGYQHVQDRWKRLMRAAREASG